MTQYFVSPELNEKYDIKARPEKKNLDKRPPDLSHLLQPRNRPKLEDLESFQTNTTPQNDSGDIQALLPQTLQTRADLFEATIRQDPLSGDLQAPHGFRPASEAVQEVKKESNEAKDAGRHLIAPQLSGEDEKRGKLYRKNTLIRDLIETIEGVLLNTSKSVEEGTRG